MNENPFVPETVTEAKKALELINDIIEKPSALSKKELEKYLKYALTETKNWIDDALSSGFYEDDEPKDMAQFFINLLKDR